MILKGQPLEHFLSADKNSAGSCALALHLAGDVGLVFSSKQLNEKSPDSAQIQVADKDIDFLSLSDRNQILADYIFLHAEREKFEDPSYVLGLASGLWKKEIGRSDFSSGRFLVKVNEVVDVLALGASHIRGGADAFGVLHVMSAYLTHAHHLNNKSLLDLARAQHDKTKRDFLSGFLYSGLEQLLSKNDQFSRDLYEAALSEIDDITANLINVCIVSLAKNCPDEAVGMAVFLINSASEKNREIGRWASGNLLLSGNISETSRSLLEGNVLEWMSSTKSNVREAAVRAATSAMHITAVFDEALESSAKDGDVHVLTSIANALFLKSKEMLEGNRFYKWLPILVNLPPSSRDQIGGFDFALSNNLSRNNPQYAEIVGFLTAWIEKHGADGPRDETFADCFSHSVQKVANDNAALSELTTLWLASENRKLAASVAGLLNQLEVNGLEEVHLDLSQIREMSKNEFLFVVRKMLGFIGSSNHLMSLSGSLLKIDEAVFYRNVDILGQLFVSELGYDYPNTTIAKLNVELENETREAIRNTIRAWIAKIEEGTANLDALPRRSELRPLERIQRQIALMRRKQMSEARKNAESKSIIRHIATQIPLKAGRGCFSHHQGNFGEPMMLHSFSYSIEMPIREVLDPVGYAIRGFNMRLAKKEKA